MKLGIVIPWFGRELKGGAEQQAWQVATRLAARGHTVEVLTTCCRSHQDDWATNHLPAGASREPEGFVTRRFPVDARDRAAFDRACGELLAVARSQLKPAVSPVAVQEATVFARELIKSSALLQFLTDHAGEYTRFILLPYLYGPVIEGVRLLGARAALQPCLHDEPYAYLPQVEDAFANAGLLLFNSAGEMNLAARLFGPAILPKAHLVGEGVEPVEDVASANGRSVPQHELPNEFVLYLGRKESGKNTDLLLRAFAGFRASRPNSKLRLLLAGHGSVGLGANGAAIDLGVVDEATKAELLRNCKALVQPSENESFSRVMMEAWLRGKPVGVHAACLATAGAVLDAKGGWTAASKEDWANLFIKIDRADAGELSRLGENGRRYAETMADWNRVMERYEQALTPASAPRIRIVASDGGQPEINQCLPNLTFGDAISNQAMAIRDQLRSFGIRSRILARYIDPPMAGECEVFSAEALRGSRAIIYHHSIGTEITPHVAEFSGPKCLIYHNITPAEFFEPYWPDYAKILEAGRRELRELAGRFPMAFGVSEHNAEELKKCRFRSVDVFPLSIDPAKIAPDPEPELMARLQDGRSNVLFVGRIAPNKKQDDLVRAFAEYLAADPPARLILIGYAERGDLYAAHVRKTISAFGLEHVVEMPGTVSQAALAAYYRTAHLFWSMSEHEGFGVPFVEAMWFDVPVLAYRSSAVPETLGEAGLMFSEKTDLLQLAVLARLIVTDAPLRHKILAAQRRRRLKFLPAEMTPRLAAIARQLVGGR